MPLYEYACKKCRRQTERIEKFKGPHLKKCPHCGGPVERMASAPAIQFKGSGWYATDYGTKSGGSGDGAKAEKPGGGETAASGDTKTKESPAKESSAKESSSKESADKESAAKEKKPAPKK